MLCVLIGFNCKNSHSIVGGWEADTHVINSYSSENGNSGKLQFYFYEDLTGKELHI